MMKQYRSVRQGLPPGTLLLFRLGDFYEMFFEDAKEAAAILNVALTKRNGVPMCGVPFHAAEGYIAKLLAAGWRVAICEQKGEVKPGRLVEREITQVISPGTVIDLNLLDAKRGNYLAAIKASNGSVGVAWLETSTGEFRLAQYADMQGAHAVLARLTPSEVLVPDDEEDAAALRELTWPLFASDAYSFEYEHAELLLREHFRVHSLDGFGLPRDARTAIGCAGAILHYVKHHLRRDASHVLAIKAEREESCVQMDAATLANLEVVQSRGAGKNTSLLNAVDRTVTPMGGRRLRAWLLRPLCDVAAIRARQDRVAAWIKEEWLLNQTRESLKNIRDIERIVGRFSQGSGTPRDLAALRVSIKELPKLAAYLDSLETTRAPGQGSVLPPITPMPELEQLLDAALADEPPAHARDGGIFREGYNSELDELRRASVDGKSWVAAFQQEEIERTGIKSLKVRYNAVFGYYIEVTRANLSGVPLDYTRKQTTVNAERFITPTLKEMEAKILGAEERARVLEQSLYAELRDRVVEQLPTLLEVAAALAELDAITALAESARLHRYVRPVVDEGDAIIIRDGRHPVLDQALLEEKFVPNDTTLDRQTSRLHIITGPNMAGKSTYIRQVALITLLAQTGSFVPAASAHIGVVDRIFTRVGASDDLGRGQSTFMVEMNETANILHNATRRSLVVLDEIGRGTSTFDGIAIAWSVAEHLHDVIEARTLFATHYHELTELERLRPAIKNFNVAVREWNDQIVFLRRIVEGAADKSYGIHVGRLAGLPAPVIARAREILANLESGEFTPEGKPRIAETHGRNSQSEPAADALKQPYLF